MPTITSAMFVLAVPDLKRSAAYYRDVLGFHIHDSSDPGWRFFVRDSCTIFAGQCPDAIPSSELGDHSYFAYLSVDDVDAYHDQIVKAGGNIGQKPADKPWGYREFSVVTVDGHRIMFSKKISE